MVTGAVHKITSLEGEWVLSGTASITTHGTQKTVITLADGRA